MADILTQEEIDALLTASTPAGSKDKAAPATEEVQVLVVWLVQELGLSSKDPELPQLLAKVMAAFESKAPPLDLSRQLEETLLPHDKGSGTDEDRRQALGPKIAALVERLAEVQRQRQGVSQVTPYDFKHPARVNKDQIRTLENLHDNFARSLSSTFSSTMRAVVDVDTAFVDQTTYAEFIMSLSNPSCSYQFTLGPTSGQAIIDFAMPVVFAFVDRIFGGKGSAQGVGARQLTPLEIGVINRIIKRVIEDLEATWESILRVEITDIELETIPEFMQITAASEIVILLAFEVKSTNAAGLISLCYPFFTLESILPLLGQKTYGRSQQRRMPKRRDRLGPLPLDVLGPVPVPLHLELGQANLPLTAARGLKVGDLLPMDSHNGDPGVLYVGDRPKYYAQPYADGETLGVEITGAFPRELYSTRGIR